MDKAADIADRAQASLRANAQERSSPTAMSGRGVSTGKRGGSIDMDTRAHRMKFIDRLFVVMQVTYGHWWSSLFNAPTEEEARRMVNAHKAQWALALHPWSEEQVMAGMDRCRRCYEKPPTLPQFMNLLRTDRVHEHYKALPRPPCDKGKAKAQIEQMRDLLKRAS